MTSEPPCNWREEGDVVYFSVTSRGTTGKEWIIRLKSKDGLLDDYTKKVLRSSDFKPTSGVTTEVAVLKGTLFKDKDRITEKIRAEADKRKLGKPNAEVACLIREKFTDKEIEAMGLWWIITMHKPINVSDGDLLLLGANRLGAGDRLSVFYESPARHWDVGEGFAFVRK